MNTHFFKFHLINNLYKTDIMYTHEFSDQDRKHREDEVL